MAALIAALVLSVFTIAASVLHQVDPTLPWCDETVKSSFMSNCGVLKANPGHLRDIMGMVKLRTRDSQYCVSSIDGKSRTTLVVKESFEPNPLCCNAEETDQIVKKRVGDVPADRAAHVFGSMATGKLAGFSYYEVIPARCPTGAGCPLVVEISGAGGHPWAMGLSLCTVCKAQMNVVMMAPILGAEENTTKPFVRNIVALVSAYIEKASNINPERVWLASVSRGNEIGIQAAIFGAHIFKAVVMTGKFKIPDTFDITWRRNRANEFVGKPKLARVILHIGDEDDVLTDEEFYPKFVGLTKIMTKAIRPPNMVLNLYEGAGHDITWTTWNEMHAELWTGETS